MQGLLSATGDITSVKVKQELQAQIALLQAQINALTPSSGGAFNPITLKTTIPVNAWVASGGGGTGYEAVIQKSAILNLDNTANNWAMGFDDVFQVVPANNTTEELSEFANISAISVDNVNKTLVLYDREGSAPTIPITIRITVLNPTLDQA